jgi:hypothetical protein
MESIDLFSLSNVLTYNVNKKLTKNSNVILGHLTSSTFYDWIMEKGILASSITSFEGCGGHELPDDHEYVYLTRYLDTFFSENAIKKFGGKQILIIVEVPINMIETDPYGGNLASSELFEINKVITGTQRNFRVKNHIPPEMIQGVYSIDSMPHTVYKNMPRPLTYTEIKEFLSDQCRFIPEEFITDF